MRRAIGKVLCENRLPRGINREFDEFPAHVGLWRALEDRPALRCPQMLGPDDFDWRTVVDGGLGARIPARTNVDLATLQELGGLGAPGPPDRNVLLDRIELLEGSIEIERIELLAWDAVGQHRLLDRVEWMLAHRPATRNFLHIEQICPGLGRLLAFALVSVSAVGKDSCKHIIADEILGLVLGGRCIDVRRFDVQLFEISRAFVAQLIGGGKRDQAHVPGISLRIDHALDEACRLVLTLQANGLDARGLCERLVKCFFEAWRIRPTRIADEDPFLLRRSLLPIDGRKSDRSSAGKKRPTRQIELTQTKARRPPSHARLPSIPSAVFSRTEWIRTTPSRRLTASLTCRSWSIASRSGS